MTIGGDGGTVSFDVPVRDAERSGMEAVVADQHALAGRLGRFRAGVEPQWMALGFAHVMGTCRTGEHDDDTCVADGFGRVWGPRTSTMPRSDSFPPRSRSTPH
jgi:choline dehydrogenase-like flavoprotein